MPFCILNCRPTFPPARIVPGATRRAGNASRTPSPDQTQRREAVAKQVRKWPKFPTHPKYTRVPISLQNYQCPGTNQKYCASQQGDCKHIGYCDPNATCKKKANVSKQYSSIKTRIDVLMYWSPMPLARIRPMWVLVDWSHVCFQFWKFIGVLVDWSVVTYEFLVLYLHIDVLMDWSNACLQYCKHIDVLMDWPKHFLLCRSYHYIMRTTTNQPWDSLSLEWHQNITILSVQLLCFTIICNDLG